MEMAGLTGKGPDRARGGRQFEGPRAGPFPKGVPKAVLAQFQVR